MSSARVVLRLTQVEKHFPGVRALKGVSFDVREGEVHALVGENGAGKSTLMAVAAGATAPDQGIVEIGRAVLSEASPATAQAAGLAVVYQHTSVLDDLTVAENMAFSMPAGEQPSLAHARAWAAAHLANVGIDLDPAAPVTELSVAGRQLLEIAKALARSPKVLVLDEPTESLTAAESERLFDQLHAITARGAAVVYISHRLPEVLRVADRLTVLRDGEVRGTFDRRDVSEEQVLDLIVGRSIDHAFPDKGKPATAGEPLLSVRTLSSSRFHDVDLDLGRGEIVGLAGIEGNGQREFIRALAGIDRARGSVTLHGKPVSLRSPRSVQDAGIVYLPGDRHAEGLFLELSVAENASMLSLDRVSTSGVLRPRRERELSREQIDELGIKAPGTDTPVATLSGGNQQKVLFARSMACEPMVLLADEPTRGVDAGARLELYRILRRAADQGRAVIVLSSDALELQGLCDRVIVFSRGQVVTTLTGDGVTEQNITGAALTAAKEHRRTTRDAPRRVRVTRFIRGDYAPAVILAIAVLGLALYTNSHNGFFLGKRSVDNLLLLASALAFISFGQLIVLLTAGVDLSVGPLAGLTVVVLSFFAQQGQGAATLVLGLVVMTAVALTVGGTNALLIRRVKLSPVLATLAMYIVLQGVSLQLRSQPGGSFSISFTNALTTSIGGVPVAFIICVVLAAVAELGLRRTRWGLTLRAVGSDEERARRLGTRVGLVVTAAYAGCAVFTMLGGLMLSSQLGVGDPSAGINYTLTSITAVVLGGASIFGGRGSFIGALLGALLLQEIASASPFLGLGQAWQYWLPGLLILGAAGLYSRARGVRLAGAS
jgi:ribose transport system ATP-binding protein